MNTAEQYAQALHEASRPAGATPELFARFMSVLKKRGHDRLLPRVATAYKKLLVRDELREPRVRIAHEGERTPAIARTKDLLGKEPTRIVVDETLVSGFVVESNTLRFDVSGRRSLLDLYHRLIAE